MEKVMRHTVDFPLLFDRIREYLAHAPHATDEQLESAKEAYNTLVSTIYTGWPLVKCDHAHPSIPTL